MKKIISVIFILSCVNLHSQSIDDARNNSMGGVSVSNSFSIGAFDNNPANLIYNRQFDNSKYHLALFSSLGFIMNSDFLSLDFYDKYFAGDEFGIKKVLSETEKQEIYSKSQNSESHLSLSFKLLTFVYHIAYDNSVGISVSDKVHAKNYIPEALSNLGLFGNKKNTLYDLSEFNVSLLRFRQINLSYGRSFDKIYPGLSAGISFKPTFGYQYMETRENNLSIFTNDSNQITGAGSVVLRTAGLDDVQVLPGFGNNSGFGMGFDIGFNFRFSDRLNAGLSITDLGWIKWSTNTKDEFFNGEFELTDLSESNQLDTLKKLIEGEKIPIDEFTVSLPLNMRLGFTYKFFDKHKLGSEAEVNFEQGSISLEYLQGFSNKIAGATLNPRISLGGEYLISRKFAVRSGMAVGGMDKFTVSFGLGMRFEPISIDIGTHNILSVADPRVSSRNSFQMSITAGF